MEPNRHVVAAESTSDSGLIRAVMERRAGWVRIRPGMRFRGWRTVMGQQARTAGVTVKAVRWTGEERR